MFTGIVQAMGEVVAIRDDGPGRHITVSEPGIAADASIGASIAVNGCCLTVVRLSNDQMSFDAGPETLSRTNLGRLAVGSRANLEGSLHVGDELGGHFVTGHIDGLGSLAKREDDAEWSTLWFRVDPKLTRQMVTKGSVAVDGVSLTLIDVLADQFSVQLIPHTLAVTTLGPLQAGDVVNIETDVLAKYVEKQLAGLSGRPEN